MLFGASFKNLRDASIRPFVSPGRAQFPIRNSQSAIRNSHV
jgi:hypothetical protein